MTHDRLDALAERAADWLAALGVRSGDRVLIVAETSTPFVVAYLGVLRVGAVVVLAGDRLAEPELRYMVRDAAVTVLLGPARSVALLEEIARDSDTVATVVDLADVMDLPQHRQSPRVVTFPSSAAPALLTYTSGTTGTPKRVVLTHANLLASIRAAVWAWRWSQDDVLVHALPLYHQHGLGGLHAVLLTGARLVVAPRFDADELMRIVEDQQATVLFAVPAMYQRLVEAGAAARADTSSLRLAVSGSAPLSPELAMRVADALGVAPLERYGTTESGLNVSNPIDGPRRIGTVGLPLPGVDLRIVDPNGCVVAEGTDGEILLRGPQVFAGYAGRPGAEFDDDGWFRTGDVGRLESDGYLRITGRLKELIISGGFNVYPREVELALEHDPDVEQAAVVGVPSERWGEEVVAFVVPREGVAVEPARVIAGCRERLAAYKCPKQVHLIADLPRNPMGKLLRAPLVARATAASVQQAGAARALERLRAAEAKHQSAG